MSISNIRLGITGTERMDFLAALDADEIFYNKSILLADPSVINPTVISISIASVSALVTVCRAWVKAKSGRKIKLSNKNGESIELQGLSNEEAIEIIKLHGLMSVEDEN